MNERDGAAMASEAWLQGKQVLVLEDDYYLATDACRILEDAGAEVVGPFGRGVDALDALERCAVDAGVIDINLGSGPEFRVAEVLRERGIRFIFATGYGDGVVPPDLSSVRRLEKPFKPSELLAALSSTLD